MSEVVKGLNLFFYAKSYHLSWNLSKSFQENPYALENEEDVYESNGRFEPFSFLDSTLKVAEVVHSTLTLDTRMSENNPCSTPLGKIIKILAPEIVAIVNNMFTTMTLFPLRIFILIKIVGFRWPFWKWKNEYQIVKGDFFGKIYLVPPGLIWPRDVILRKKIFFFSSSGGPKKLKSVYRQLGDFNLSDFLGTIFILIQFRLMNAKMNTIFMNTHIY